MFNRVFGITKWRPATVPLEESNHTTYMFLSGPNKVIRLELILKQVPWATFTCGSLESVQV